MARFETTISEMYNAASKLRKATEEFLSAACTAYSAAEALGASWEGDAQVAFMQEQQKAVEWQKKMAAIVQSYVQRVESAAKAYQEADQQATSTIRNGGGIGDAGSGVHKLDWTSITQPIMVTLYGGAFPPIAETPISTLYAGPGFIPSDN